MGGGSAFLGGSASEGRSPVLPSKAHPPKVEQTDACKNITFSRFATQAIIISFLIKVVEEELDAQQTQISNIEVDVSLHDERLDVMEDDVDVWDDKITALEVANVDITDRLTTVEELLLGNMLYLIFLLLMFLFNMLHLDRNRCKM